MIKRSNNVFHIWFLSFYDSAYPVDELVPDVVDDEHLVLSLLDLSFEVSPDIRVMVDRGQCAHMKVLFERSVGHGMYPGLSEYRRAGSEFKGHHPAITSELFRVVITGKEVCEDSKVQGGYLTYSGNGSDEADSFVEPVIGEDEFLYFGLHTFYFCIKTFIDAFKIVLGQLPKFRGEEFQFVGIFVDIGPGIDQFPTHLEQDLDFFKDLWHRYKKLHFPMVFGYVLGDSNGIDLIVLSSLYTHALGDLYGHLDTEVGLFPNKLCDDEPAIDTGMLHTHKRVLQVDSLVSEQSNKCVGSFFGIFKHIRGSPIIFDNGHVKAAFRYIDTDKAREVFSVHNE